MTTLPWSERVTMISVNPHAATIDDIARLAAQHIDLYRELKTVEHSRQVLYGAKVLYTCPRCHVEEPNHAPDCTIDAALKAAEGR